MVENKWVTYITPFMTGRGTPCKLPNGFVWKKNLSVPGTGTIIYPTKREMETHQRASHFAGGCYESE